MIITVINERRNSIVDNHDTVVPRLSGHVAQGISDPISMAVYAIAIIPLILMLLEAVIGGPYNSVREVAYADDLTAGGKLRDLKYWWDTLLDLGPKFGYYPQASKSWLIVKENAVNEANTIFSTSNIPITSSGKRHLGAVIGSLSYKDEYMNEKVQNWSNEIKVLSEIAKIEPQSAFACFVSGYKHKLTYFMRTIPDIKFLLKPVDDVVTTWLIPAITGGIACSEQTRMLMSLPPKLGGLGIPIFANTAEVEYQNSIKITKGLKDKITNQDRSYVTDENLQSLKSKLKVEKNMHNLKLLEKLRTSMTETEKRLNDISREQCASICYVLNKPDFWDNIRIRYGWQ